MLAQLSPAVVWKHFSALLQIPRPSGHEQAAIAYIDLFARELGLDRHIDAAGNLVVRKKAAQGREGAPTVILQTHVDMVPQKNSDKQHDFEKDPIEAIIDGEWVKANGTTLGADNGIGIAAAMAVLESGSISHGPVEALFTISEETGMDGAFGLKPGLLKGSVLLNLDSEEEGELFIGCAGGVDVNINAAYREEKVSGRRCIKIQVSGLKGGHSGMDINLGRANATRVLVDLIQGIATQQDLRLHSLAGGNLRNAIPREAEAIVTLPEDDYDTFRDLFQKHRVRLQQAFAGADEGMQLKFSEVQAVDGHMNAAGQQEILRLLTSCPDGVIQMSKDMPDIVETSNNIAIVNIEQGKLGIKMLLRSASDAEKDRYGQEIRKLFDAIGAVSSLSGAYPGWLPDAGSDILKKADAAYRKLFNKKPLVRVIHAGLECGIIAGVYPGLDMISFGPTIKFPHSPDEKVHIPSVDRFWMFLKAILESL